MASSKAADAIAEIRRQEGILKENYNEQKQLFDKQYYTNIMDRTDVQYALKQLREEQETERKRQAARNAISGATEEAQLAGQDSLNKSYADSTAKIASQANILKDGYMSNWQNYLQNYYAQRLGMSDKIAGVHQGMSNQWSQMASSAFKSGGAMLGNGMAGLLK